MIKNIKLKYFLKIITIDKNNKIQKNILLKIHYNNYN